MSSTSPVLDPRSDSLVPCSPEFFASGMAHTRHLAVQRLPRIDEHVHQEVQAFQGDESRNDQQGSHSLNHHNNAQDTSCSPYMYNGSGQLPTSFHNANQQGFLSHNSGFPTGQSSNQPQSFFSNSLQRVTMAAQQNQSHSYHPNDSHHCMGRPQHPAFLSNVQAANTMASMSSQQDFSYLGDACNDHHQHHLHPQQADQKRPSINYIARNENNDDNNSGLSFEESPIDGRSDFQREQLPSGNYEPELGMTENPFYFSVNQMLYEAHVSRVRRLNQFPDGS